jgi:hypothetical protein
MNFDKKLFIMSKFRIIPLAKQYADAIKERGFDDFGNILVEETATGYGPCRISLKPFKPGTDKRLVLSHSPFESKNAYNQPGPIFIFSGDVEEYADVHKFPEEIKNNKEHFKMTLIGYNEKQWMVFTEIVKNNDIIDRQIEIAFDLHPEIAYLHVRSAEAACYMCKIVRA